MLLLRHQSTVAVDIILQDPSMGHLLLNGMNMCHCVLYECGECAVDLVGIYLENSDVAQPYLLVAVLQPHTYNLSAAIVITILSVHNS